MSKALSYQPTLFDRPEPVEKKPAVVLDIKTARRHRDEGINKAVDHADDELPQWSERAFDILLEFLKGHNGNFMCEDVRQYANEKDFELPPSNKAWGGVIQKAAKSGLIVKMGYAPVKNIKANCTPATVWRQEKYYD